MLTVSENRRFLLKNDEFFPYIGDTAWSLLKRLSREDMLYYLDKRKMQGYNLIQVSAIAEFDDLTNPNFEGELSFFDKDIDKPNPRYFELVSFLADECEKRDIVLGLLPTWGDKFNQKWGIGPEVFTPENAYSYGSYLADLIGERENIIWILGGDRPLENETHRAIIDEMARGIKQGEHCRHLMTYHPSGEASSFDFLPNCSYIDFHMLQSSHDFGGFKSEEMVKKTLEAENKPCIDAECCYEDFPISFEPRWGFRFSDKDIRRRIYNNMMAGALGHTYGHQSVWCFRDETDEEYLYSWREALDRPMANEMQYINELLKIAPITNSEPIDIAFGVLARRCEDYIMLYLPDSEPYFIDTDKNYVFKGGLWFDPATGNTVKADDFKSHITAISPFAHDAVLILYT